VTSAAEFTAEVGPIEQYTNPNQVAFALLRDKKLFNPPLWDGQPLTKNILTKLRDENNQAVAQKTLDSILSTQDQQKVS